MWYRVFLGHKCLHFFAGMCPLKYALIPFPLLKQALDCAKFLAPGDEDDQKSPLKSSILWGQNFY